MRKVIFGLAHPLMRPPRLGERGAIGMLIAIFLGSGVLLGIGVMVIDVGQLYQERAELQNGADAAALAVAKSCADGTCNTSLATQYANGNASTLTGHTAGVSLICGSSLGTCPAATGAATDCPSPPAGVGYVDVHTATKLPDGSTLLPPTFAGAVPGLQAYRGTTVQACGQAGWGAPSAGTTIAFTISACAWDQATSLGTSFAPAPPAVPAASFDTVIHLHGTTSTSSQGCASEPSGADGPGNFGWASDSGNCSISISGTTYSGNTGVSASQACKTQLAALQLSRAVAFIPVYVGLSGKGSNATYTLKGFAAFVVTGYFLPGFSAQDWLNPANTCKGSSKCITGYFTQTLIPKAAGSFGGPDLGATILKLTG